MLAIALLVCFGSFAKLNFNGLDWSEHGSDKNKKIFAWLLWCQVLLVYLQALYNLLVIKLPTWSANRSQVDMDQAATYQGTGEWLTW